MNINLETIQSVYEMSPVPFYSVRILTKENSQDLDFTLEYANSAFYQFIGYSKSEFAAKFHNKIMDVVYKEDAAKVSLSVKNQLAVGPYIRKRARICCKDHSIKWIDIQAHKQSSETGEEFLFCIFVDFTEQHQTEEALRISEEKFRIATKNSDISFWTYDFNTKEIRNTAVSKKVHRNQDMVSNVPESLIECGYVRQDSVQEFVKLYKKLKRGDKTASGNFWFKRNDNNGWWCEHIDYTNTFDEEGRPVRAYAVGRDITREIQQQIQSRQLTVALENCNLYVWEFNIVEKKVIHQANAMSDFNLERVVENAPEASIARGIIHPDSAEAYREFHRAAASGERTPQAEICYVKSDGTHTWRHCTYTTVFSEEGRPINAIGCAVDISRSKAMERRFEEERIYSDAVQADNLLVKARVNITRNWVESYHAKLELSISSKRYSYDETVKSLIKMGATEEDKKKIRMNLSRSHVLRAFADGDNCFSIDYRRKISNGSAIWVNTTLKSYTNSDTGDIMSFMYTYDIDEEKIKEGIIQSVTSLEYDYISYIDLKRDQYRLYMGEEEMQQLIPIQAATYTQAVYEMNHAVIAPEDEERAIADMLPDGIRKNLKKQRVFSTVYTVYDDNGEVRQKRLQYAYLDEANEQIVCTRTDVTDLLAQQTQQQNLLESALLAAKQASSAKSDFLSRMSHEIRTPMNAIIGMSAIAAQSIGNDSEVADCIGKIGISSRFLLSLINDILDMSRIESGKMLLKNEKIPFEEFLNGINSICFTQAQAKNIDYENIVDPSIDDFYIGDAMKLQQVVINILSNAIKFTPEKGKVSYSVQEIKKDKYSATIRFIINDTGCGISDEFIPRVFDPFAQEHMGTTTIYGGTGLGLAICKNLVDMMDGHIGVRSIVGAGTEFTVDVKLGITEESRTRYLQKPQYDFAQMKVLVVDDDITVCEHTVITLKEIGVTAEWVDSGRKAVDTVQKKWDQKEYYDFVLVDWKMPDMDGIETARRIRKIVGPDVTIIIMTAYDWSTIEHEAKLAGVNLLMSKPMFKSNLISAFEKALGKQKEKDTLINENFHFDGQRILLAEDHPLNVEVATRLLKTKGLSVEHAENGLRALEMFTSTPVGYYDAILMDIRMPDMDGLQTSYNIRRWRKEDAKTIPIIAMTANAFEEDIQKSKAAGMNAHLAKPIAPQQLYQTLYDFLCGKQD